jgi:dienelactone hydrolase
MAPRCEIHVTDMSRKTSWNPRCLECSSVGRRLTVRVAFGLLLLSSATAQTALPGTEPLTAEGDLAAEMVDGINRYLEEATVASQDQRTKLWKRNYESAQSYEQSIAPNREHFRRIVGAVDTRLPAPSMQLEATTAQPALVSEGSGYKVYAVRWPVFEGVDGEGLLLQPEYPVARIVAIPDADWSPEMLAGLAPGVEPEAQIARRLAESGCEVLVPLLIDRADTWSGIPGIGMTNQPHREWIYRMAFEVGRHIIGYEVQKVLAGVDWFTQQNSNRTLPIGVAGYGEGGLLALYSAALDPRIQATLVSGYFQSRQGLWKEPIYRDVWALLHEFGDAEIASLVAPRALILEASRGPQISGPPLPTKDRTGATPNGRLDTPALESVRIEFERAKTFFAPLNATGRLRLIVSGDSNGLPGSGPALAAFLESLGIKTKPPKLGAPPKDHRDHYDPSVRLHRQFNQLVNYTQLLIRNSPAKRAAFWAKADSSSPERWRETTGPYRDYIWEEVIGRLPSPSLPANARTRLISDELKFRAYEVMLDVWPDVFAYGILLVPKNIQPGERRPVVVCQHGLEGRPEDVANSKIDSPFYHKFAVRLAEEGFVTYAPQNPYIGEDRFRLIQRRGHPLKLALFSFILGQHQRTLEWLAGLPYVDPARIGFYGLSYGGKTAVRVPPLLENYALSICSADFNEWVWKNTTIDSPYSYLLTREYDMVEFDFANVVNYSDLANLMAPRPFMVERGHSDTVAPDEEVAYEFAKVRQFFDVNMDLPNRAEIEFFNGPHTINGKGSFEFLRLHLKWPD